MEKKNFLQRESLFILLMGIFLVAALIFRDNPAIAMWIGFALAGYSAIANDSIQTLGTFIASNQKRPWWVLWIFIGGIMLAVLLYGWSINSGDAAFGRLEKIAQPESFNMWQLGAPIVLLILTRFKMPVSTTFLILSVFSTNKTIGGMLEKTFIGYFVAFLSALAIWAVIAQMLKHKVFFKEQYNEKAWRFFQWITTAYLWTTWLMQDLANITVFLPRALSFNEILLVAGFLLAIMGLILYRKGGRIQQVITEKADVVAVRSATLIDLVLGTLLLIFKEWNNLPMSTTWVFLGLLAGREIALTQLSGKEKPYLKTLGLVMKDIALAAIGIVVSLLLALLARGDFSSLNELFVSVLG